MPNLRRDACMMPDQREVADQVLSADLLIWQALSNTVWALSKLDRLDETLFTAIVQQVLQQLTRFNAQNVANTVSTSGFNIL